jgi:hypothetical protein
MATPSQLSLWTRFWHLPVRAERLAITRIMLGGFLVVEQLVEFLPHLMEYYGPNGVAPQGVLDRTQLDYWYWTMLFFNSDDPVTVYTWFFVWMAVAVAFTMGIFTRTMNVALWFLTACFMTRNFMLLCGSDDVLQIGIFLLMLAPSGRALSVDAWLRRRRGLEVGPVFTPAWPVRLLQIQLCVIYCTTGLVKIKGTGLFEGTWWDGSSIHYAINYIGMNRYSYDSFPVPAWATKPLTWFTVSWEVMFPLLVMSRWTRKWTLAYGILFHLGIFVTMAIGWFGFYMIALYGVWTTDAFWEWWHPMQPSQADAPAVKSSG